MAQAALTAKLLPGRYRLRAAVLDAARRAGVVERPLDVGLRGDASVQFVEEAIDERLYAAIGTRAGDEAGGLEGR